MITLEDKSVVKAVVALLRLSIPETSVLPDTMIFEDMYAFPFRYSSESLAHYRLHTLDTTAMWTSSATAGPSGMPVYDDLLYALEQLGNSEDLTHYLRSKRHYSKKSN